MTTLDPARLRAYLTRVGIDAPARAERDALDALIAAQLAAIPFENIDPLLRRPVAIDADSVFDKLVTRARGGYCFELNTLLAAALEALGFRVTPLAARVRWQVPPDRLTLQTHMLLRVEAAHRSYIVDVGFGGPTPDRALPLDGERDDTGPIARPRCRHRPRPAPTRPSISKRAATAAGARSTASTSHRSIGSISCRATGTSPRIPTASSCAA